MQRPATAKLRAQPVLAADIGGTRIKLGAILEGRVLAREAIDAHSDLGLEIRLPEVAKALRRVCATLGLKPEDCLALGVSFPSIVRANWILASYGKYEDAPGIDLPAWAEREFGLPFAIENDGRCALLGEWRHGAGRGTQDLVMITLGTGHGTAALIEGKMLRGRHGQAGCLGGHFTVRLNGRPCSCGNAGCSEAEASTLVLRDLARGWPGFASSALARVERLDYAAVFEAAGRGDACAQSLRDHSLQVWGALTVNLIHAYDPEVVVLGGGLMRSKDLILPAVSDYVNRHAHTPWGQVEIRAAELGDDAALLGCAVLVEEMPEAAKP